MIITQMKKTDFKEVPSRISWNSEEEKFDSFVIIPTRKKHDSGWMCMEVIGCRDYEPVVNLTKGSDVVHIDGIGGYNSIHSTRSDRLVVPQGWAVDCLPCGYLRLYCNNGATVGNSLSDFELFGCKE